MACQEHEPESAECVPQQGDVRRPTHHKSAFRVYEKSRQSKGMDD